MGLECEMFFESGGNCSSWFDNKFDSYNGVVEPLFECVLLAQAELLI